MNHADNKFSEYSIIGEICEKMNYAIFKDYEEMSTSAAEIIIQEINENPYLFIGLTAEKSLLRILEFLADQYRLGKVDFSNCRFASMYEWMGKGIDDEKSSNQFLIKNFFSQVNVSPTQIISFDGQSQTPVLECKRMDKNIVQNGGLDLVLLGIGPDSKIEFNRPSSHFSCYSHVQRIGSKYYDDTGDALNLPAAYLVGYKHIAGAREVLVIANGLKQAQLIKKTLKGNFHLHLKKKTLGYNTTYLLDQEAGSLLYI